VYQHSALEVERVLAELEPEPTVPEHRMDSAEDRQSDAGPWSRQPGDGEEPTGHDDRDPDDPGENHGPDHPDDRGAGLQRFHEPGVGTAGT
jgi:hypothetical protein